MNKIVLLLMMLVGVFADWKVFGSNELDKNGSEIFPKPTLFVEYNKINGKNDYDGYILTFGTRGPKGSMIRYVHLETNTKGVEGGTDYYIVGGDSGRKYTQKVGLTWMAGFMGINIKK